MLISSIEKGTLFDIEVFAGNLNTGEKFAGTLNNSVDDVFLLIASKGLYIRCSGSDVDLNMLLTFYRGSIKYSFYCKSKSTQISGNLELTEIVAITAVKRESRRAVPRFSSAMEVKLYGEGGMLSTEPVCVGQADDISSNGICFLTDSDLSARDNGRFSMEFTLFEKNFFRLSVMLLHRKKAPFYTRYSYGYVFLFDFSGWPDEKARLVDIILKERIRAMED